MPFIPLAVGRLSDLVFHEIDPSVGYARRVVYVTTTEDMPMGTIVFRAKAGVTSQNDPYEPVTSPADDFVDTNEFAVVFGDGYGCKAVTVAAESGETAAVAYVRGEVQLKDDLLCSVNGVVRGTAEYDAMKKLLEDQGIIVEVTLGAE